jgi:hypothetical protein
VLVESEYLFISRLSCLLHPSSIAHPFALCLHHFIEPDRFTRPLQAPERHNKLFLFCRVTSPSRRLIVSSRLFHFEPLVIMPARSNIFPRPFPCQMICQLSSRLVRTSYAYAPSDRPLSFAAISVIDVKTCASVLNHVVDDSSADASSPCHYHNVTALPQRLYTTYQ